MKNWVDTVLLRSQLRKVLDIAKKYRLSQALQTWRQSKELQAEEESQIYRVLTHFETQRPESLMMFQKAFLIQLSQDDSTRVKICSTVLAKYVFEKWRNLRPLLRHKK